MCLNSHRLKSRLSAVSFFFTHGNDHEVCAKQGEPKILALLLPRESWAIAEHATTSPSCHRRAFVAATSFSAARAFHIRDGSR